MTVKTKWGRNQARKEGRDRCAAHGQNGGTMQLPFYLPPTHAFLDIIRSVEGVLAVYVDTNKHMVLVRYRLGRATGERKRVGRAIGRLARANHVYPQCWREY